MSSRKKSGEKNGEKKGEKKGGRLGASFTVEASLLMGIILFVLVSLIYEGFYLHDSAAAQAAVCELAAAASNHWPEKDGEAALMRLRGDLEKNGWTAAEARSLSLSAGRDAVSASFTGSVRVPGAAPFLGEGDLSITKSRSRSILKPADLIRRGRGIKALLRIGE